MTVSFDKTVRFWDPRQAEHVAGFNLDYKPFCSDVFFPYLAIGLSEAKCLIVDLRKAQEELGGKVNYMNSPLGAQAQITSIKIFSDEKNKMGLGISGNEMRGNLSYFAKDQNMLKSLDNIMIFKAVKGSDKIEKVYPINCLGFHPHRGGQFLYTGSGAGKMHFWDAKEKNRIAEFDFKGVPVNQVEIDPSGKYMAYALGYDWARGLQGYMTQPSKVCVHVLQDRELESPDRRNITYP